MVMLQRKDFKKVKKCVRKMLKICFTFDKYSYVTHVVIKSFSFVVQLTKK